MTQTRRDAQIAPTDMKNAEGGRVKIVTGEWDGRPIWRWATPEEALIKAGVDVEAATLYVATQEALRL